MRIELEMPQKESILWVLGLLRFTWLPFAIAVAGRWIISLLDIGTASLIAFVAVQLGRTENENNLIPEVVRSWLLEGENPALKAIALALILISIAGAVETFTAWTATWQHIIIHQRLTPAAIEATLVGATERSLEPSLAVQRWLLKTDIVEFLHNGVASILGTLGTLAFAIIATFRADYKAGLVCLGCLVAWAVICVFLTLRALIASRNAAREHEAVGRIIRDTAALRNDLSRPSLALFWLERSGPDIRKLGESIKAQGIWGSLLFGALGALASAIPMLALFVAALSGNLGASVAVYLYLSRIVGPLGNLAATMPMLQNQSISIQRMFDVFSEYSGKKFNSEEPPISAAKVELFDAAVTLDGNRQIRFPNLSVSTPEILCIIGPSGCGKSTLLNCLAGQRLFSQGTLLLDETPVEPTSSCWRETRALVPQEPELLPGSLKDNLDYFPNWKENPEIIAAANSLLKATSGGKESIVGVDVPGVSVGQRRAVALLRSLGSDALVLLLDEPIAGLDESLVELLKPAIEEAAGEGRIIIMALHQHDCERLGLNNAKVVYMPNS